MDLFKKDIFKLGFMSIVIVSITACASFEKKQTDADEVAQVLEYEVVQPKALNLEDYETEFSEYTFEGETEINIGDRHFLTEDKPENSAEESVFHHYYYNIAGEYDLRSSIYGDNEALQISARNEKESFDEHAYMREYVMHSLSTWSKEDFLESTYATWDMFRESLLEYQLSSFVVVQAEISME